MPKPVLKGRAPRQPPRDGSLPEAVEGRIAEVCRAVSVEVRRMRQLQEQADELLAVVRQWAGHPAPAANRRGARGGAGKAGMR